MSCRTFFFSFSCWAIASFAAYADSSICDIAIKEKAYNTIESATNNRILLAVRDDLCSKTFNSEAEAQQSISQAGLNVSYGGFGVGGTKAKQDSSGKWQLSESEMCKSSAQDFQSEYNAKSRQQVATVALSAWVNCLSLTKANILHIAYSPSRDGDSFNGTIYFTINTGTTDRTITGILASGPGSKSVKCNIGGTEIDANTITTKPYEMKATSIGITCYKPPNTGDASIALQTSAGVLDWINLFSPRPLEEQIKTLQFNLDKKTADLTKGTQELSTLKIQLEGIIAGIEELKAQTEVLVFQHDKRANIDYKNGDAVWEAGTARDEFKKACQVISNLIMGVGRTTKACP